MCSIDGFTRGSPFSLADYAALNADRGPDGTTYFEDEHIHMAHSLLSISPNNTGKSQPLISGSKVFSYVGEIYGLPEGVWDTEWLFNVVKSENWRHLSTETNGMWAWVLYDEEKQTLTLSRDHFGVKGLYYMEHEGVFYWSSTMKPLIGVLNTLSNLELDIRKSRRFLGMESFYRYTNIPYKKIHSVPPGVVRTIDIKTHEVTFNWSLFDRWDISDNYFYDDEEYKEVASRCLTEAMTAPRIPKALGLSGGLDSTLLASLAQDDPALMACSIGYENVDTALPTTVVRQFVEANLARVTADQFNIPHHVLDYEKNQTQEWTDHVHYTMGATSFDIGRLGPRFANIRQAKENGAKIFFGGDLADELLTGYSGDQQLYLDREVDYSGQHPLGGPSQYQHFNKILSPTFTFSSDCKSNYMFRRLLWASEGYSIVADFIAGAFGMESRMPFLHQEYVRYVTRIPMVYRLNCPTTMQSSNHVQLGTYKRLIRDVFYDQLPDCVRTRDNKAGFSIPWDSRNAKKNDLAQEQELFNSLKILNYKIGK